MAEDVSLLFMTSLSYFFYSIQMLFPIVLLYPQPYFPVIYEIVHRKIAMPDAYEA